MISDIYAQAQQFAQEYYDTPAGKEDLFQQQLADERLKEEQEWHDQQERAKKAWIARNNLVLTCVTEDEYFLRQAYPDELEHVEGMDFVRIETCLYWDGKHFGVVMDAVFNDQWCEEESATIAHGWLLPYHDLTRLLTGCGNLELFIDRELLNTYLVKASDPLQLTSWEITKDHTAPATEEKPVVATNPNECVTF